MFGKIFASMYDGTLATKGPWQALVTFQQFLVLKDRAGIVDMTADAISRRTTIPIEIISIGITALEQPDSESRSPELDGRRIVRLDPDRAWGWKVVNHEKYNKIRSEDDRREYMKNLMAHKRANERKVLASVSSGKQQLSKLANIDVDVDVLKTNAHSPKNGEARISYHPEWFAAFWESYPKKKSKGQAIKAWDQLKPPPELVESIVNYVRKSEWPQAKYIPHPATWLNARGWEDEQPAPPKRQFEI